MCPGFETESNVRNCAKAVAKSQADLVGGYVAGIDGSVIVGFDAQKINQASGHLLYPLRRFVSGPPEAKVLLPFSEIG
jgi:hypothetical protein